MAITYPVPPHDLDNGTSPKNTIPVDTSTAGWVPGMSVIMARQTDAIGGDIKREEFRYRLAVNAKVSNIGEGVELISLGTVEILPLIAKVELVAIVSFPPWFVTAGLSPMPTLLGYEFCFTSDSKTRRIQGKVWLVPLYDVADGYAMGLHNVQTRRFAIGDANETEQ